MKIERRTSRVGLVVRGVCLAVAISCAAHRSPADELVVDRTLNIQGAFIFYLSRFVAWPAERHEEPIMPYIFCVIDNEEFESHLVRDLRGRTIRGLQVVVKGYRSSDFPESFSPACDLAYFQATDANSQRLLQAMRSRPVLTIGTSDAFLESGGIIKIFERSNKMRFVINMSGAREARLQFTSEILELAEAVMHSTVAAAPTRPRT